MATTRKAILIPWEMDKDIEVLDMDFENLDNVYDKVAPDSRLIDHRNFGRFSVYFDDEGLYTQRDNVNLRAMGLWALMEEVRLEDFAFPLVGDYLVVGPVDDEGYTLSVGPGTVILVQEVDAAMKAAIAARRGIGAVAEKLSTINKEG